MHISIFRKLDNAKNVQWWHLVNWMNSMSILHTCTLLCLNSVLSFDSYYNFTLHLCQKCKCYTCCYPPSIEVWLFQLHFCRSKLFDSWRCYWEDGNIHIHSLNFFVILIGNLSWVWVWSVVWFKLTTAF